MEITYIYVVIFGIVSMVDSCENYFQAACTPPCSPSSASRRPFDVCYRSYRDNIAGDYSYMYTCNQSYYENYTVNGYTVFKNYYNGVGCEGVINATLIQDAPYDIKCGGEDCDIVRYRIYDVRKDVNDTVNIGGCDDSDFPDSILNNNDFQERIHVIERCDDDGFVSDSYFCSSDYFYVNSYNNDKCNNDGIYAAAYYFEGCNDADEYVQLISCDIDSGLSSSDDSSASSGLGSLGIVLIVLALVSLAFIILFVVCVCKKSRTSYEIAR